MARWTDELINEHTDPDNLPGKREGRLSPDQLQEAGQIMALARDTMQKTRVIAPDEETQTDEAIDSALQLMLHSIAAVIPDSAQAPPGTYS